MTPHPWLAAAALSVAASMTIAPLARAADYYFSPSGNDANPGTSPANPFASIDKLNSLSLGPGDNVYLEGGANFTGNIYLDPGDTATTSAGAPAGAPINITSYGSGQAIINAGLGTGIKAWNNGNIQISNLHVKGTPARFDVPQQRYIYDNTGNGIEFVNTLGGDTKQSNVRVNNVTVQDFGRNGVFLYAQRGQSGYQGVEIKNVIAHSNQEAGIASFGSFDGGNRNNFSQVYVADNRAFRNYGVDGITNINNTGSGIVLGQVTDALMERNIAYENGTRCVSTQGGPVGIWAWDSANVVIQKNYSHHNGTGAHHDGGGFDLDGGVINSVMQYNYSHDNDGAGFLLAQFNGAKEFKNNIVRFNISQNDGRKNGYGAIHAFGTIDDTDVYNNTIFLGPTNKTLRNDGPQAGVKLRFFSGDDLRFMNNLFLLETDNDPSTHDPEMINANAAGVDFLHNAYWKDGDTGTFNPNDPQAFYLNWANYHDLFGPIGQGPTLNSVDDLSTILEYTLNNTSPLINEGLDLFALYGLDTGYQDFYGTARHGDTWDIGAAEAFVGQPAKAPLPEPTGIAAFTLGASALLGRRRRHV